MVPLSPTEAVRPTFRSLNGKYRILRVVLRKKLVSVLRYAYQIRVRWHPTQGLSFQLSHLAPSSDSSGDARACGTKADFGQPC